MTETIRVYIVGEDTVTKAVIERLLSYCSPRFKVFKEVPARGSEIKNIILKLNELSLRKPVILLTDLDTEDCAPILKRKLLAGTVPNPGFIINIAIDEAEAWLMADREGFADFLNIPVALIPMATPQKMGGMNKVIEMAFDAKASWVLTHEFAPQSKDAALRKQIAATGKATKGKEYNSAIIPFIKDCWDIDKAQKNSDSLLRMINRLNKLLDKE